MADASHVTVRLGVYLSSSGSLPWAPGHVTGNLKFSGRPGNLTGGRGLELLESRVTDAKGQRKLFDSWFPGPPAGFPGPMTRIRRGAGSEAPAQIVRFLRI
jgi:hypothetical protein